MPPPETGRQRAARIPLDYFKRPTRLDWGRGWWALLIAALLSLGWVGTGWLTSSQGQTYYARGPVTAVHATWDSDCTACHTPFTPVSGDAFARRWLADIPAMNQKCEACHAGPPHHAGATPDLACADCHHDHGGRDASLVRIADDHCTRCHDDLKVHTTKGSPSCENKVGDFAHHPEFKILRDNAPERGLKFNHARHMSVGMKNPPGLPTPPDDPQFKLAQIGAADRDRYRKQQPKGEDNDSALVQLQCASCHRLDGGDFGVERVQLTDIPATSVLPSRAAGGYMLPINYEVNCRGCHPLKFEAAGDAVLPHRLQPGKAHQLLEDFYTEQYLKGNTKLFEQFVSVRPLPGKLPEEETKKAQEVVKHKVEEAEKYLWSKPTCGECHKFGDDGRAVPDKILPTNIRDVWLPNAAFDHTAHRAVDCRSCHAGAYPDGADAQAKNPSGATTDVLLPGVSTCVECHAPRSTSGNVVRGGARSDCTECHRYHNGDNPLQGFGADSRRAPGRGSIDDFLKGGLGGVNAP